MFQMDICTQIGLQVSHQHSHAPLFILPFCILGKTEGKLEMVRSILAQLEYRYHILLWTSKGVPFRWHVRYILLLERLFMKGRMKDTFSRLLYLLR